MRTPVLSIVLLCAASSGCRSMSSHAVPELAADVKLADMIELWSEGGATRITDRQTIGRLQKIEQAAKWKPYWHTLPGNLGDRSIIFYSHGDELRKLFYTGTLWETKRYDTIRTASLEDADRDWIQSLFPGEADPQR